MGPTDPTPASTDSPTAAPEHSAVAPADTPSPLPFSEPFSPIPDLPPPVPDKWAHRRVEPRGLALLWTTYLLAVTLVCFGPPAALGGLDQLAGRYASRELLVLTAIGITVLWPLIRLSQVIPSEGGVTATLKDLFVIAVPAQAVVWPLTLLAMWPVSVAASMGLVLLSWTFVVGGLLAVAQGNPSPTPGAHTFRRIAWMAFFLALPAAGPVVVASLPVVTSEHADTPAMLSPITAVLEVGRERFWSGRAAAVLPEHWVAIGVTFLVGVGVWLFAHALAAHPLPHRREDRPQHAPPAA